MVALAFGALLSRPEASIASFSTPPEGLIAQYQISHVAVSSGGFAVVSVAENALEMRRNRLLERHLDLVAQTAPQYHPTDSQRDERKLMIRIALGLGVAYAIFLVSWVWATRLRSRSRRH